MCISYLLFNFQRRFEKKAKFVLPIFLLMLIRKFWFQLFASPRRKKFPCHIGTPNSFHFMIIKTRFIFSSTNLFYLDSALSKGIPMGHIIIMFSLATDVVFCICHTAKIICFCCVVFLLLLCSFSKKKYQK